MKWPWFPLSHNVAIRGPYPSISQVYCLRSVMDQPGELHQSHITGHGERQQLLAQYMALSEHIENIHRGLEDVQTHSHIQQKKKKYSDVQPDLLLIFADVC